MQIKKIALSKLLKLEIPQLAKLILDIVEKHEPESLMLEKGYAEFHELKPDIESLIVGYGPHTLNRTINPLREKRIFHASSISYQTRGMVKGYIKGDEEAIWSLIDSANLYLRDLQSTNEEIINEKIDQFLSSIDHDLKLVTAIEALGLSAHIDELTNVHANLTSLLATRNASISARPKGVLAIASKAVRSGMNNLFDRIKVAQMDNKELDYKPLINEINEQLTRYSSLIKLRKSLRNNKQNSQNSQSEMPFGMMSQMHVADATTNGFGEDLDLSMNQKKTDAPASKLLQPSTVEKKAQ